MTSEDIRALIVRINAIIDDIDVLTDKFGPGERLVRTSTTLYEIRESLLASEDAAVRERMILDQVDTHVNSLDGPS